MKVGGVPRRAIEAAGDGRAVVIVDQTLLPARFETIRLGTLEAAAAAWTAAGELAEAEVAACEAIGRHGAALVRDRFAERGGDRPLNVLTHCNAGWLATVDWGTALAPVYRLHDEGVPLHVWVSETRPRNQGLLTAWELGEHGVPHTLVVDNAAGLLFQRGLVDLCLVGT